MQRLRVCVTFDLDFATHSKEGISFDEMDAGFPLILPVLDRYFEVKTTWFVRLDGQMETLYGEADYILRHHKDQLEMLRRAGHEIGWHPHCFSFVHGEWKQNTEISSVVKELIRYTGLAQSYGMRSVRLGWAFHHNETMRLLAERGFVADSSAIPRPRYAWDLTEKDWAVTPESAYFPSVLDYRRPGQPALKILELPMSVAPIRTSYDTERVLRYVNLAYHPRILQQPLKLWLGEHSHLVTITHPYELFVGQEVSELFPFNIDALDENLLAIKTLAEGRGMALSFLTVSEFAETYRANGSA